LTRLFTADPADGYVYKNGTDEQARHNAELSRRQTWVIIAGIRPEKAYAVAQPQVAAAGNVSELGVKSGRLAANVLCPATS